MTCIILDDEPLAVKLLKEYTAVVPDIEVVYAGTDVYAALQIAQEGKVDLIFLDIQMPDLTGIQFMKILNGKSKIILTTAYEEYALQAFELDVVDYLLKPFSKERFLTAVQKARERIAAPQVIRPEIPNYIFVKSEYRIIKINLRDIFYFESLRDYVAIHHTGGKTLTLQSLRSFEEELPATDFIRIHKSYIISLAAIQSIEKKRVTIHNQVLPVSDTYWSEFRKKIPE
ncbi:MAG: LytTR family DNA-binding domain-containing protein [Chitinophagaceae bacterium]|nr:LytTR family DNA-binding domain-containing protein [Chitinophagaceae bacterium]